MPALTKEQKAAEILDKLNGLFEGDNSLPNVVDRVNKMKEIVDGLNELDLKKICEEFDKLKANQETVIKSIRNNRNSRGFVPGLEDVDYTKFSLIRALHAISVKDWGHAEFEHEIMKEAYKVKAAQAVGDDSLGGYFVPDQVIPDVIEAIYTASAFVSLSGEGTTRVSVLDGLTGAPVKVPKFDGGTIAYWVGEEDPITESNATVGEITLNPKQLGVLVRLTDAMRRWGGFGFENLLRNDLVRAAAKKLDYTIAYGKGGDHSPRGLLWTAGIKIFRAENNTLYDLNTAQGQTDFDAVSDWQGGELSFDELDDMQLGMEEDNVDIESSFAWVSAPRYFKRLKQRKITHFSGQVADQAYLIGPPILPDSALTELIGPFSKSTQIPSNSLPGESRGLPTTDTSPGDDKFGDVFGGNLGEAILGRWGGFEISDDAGRGKDFASGHVNMKLIMYTDFNVRQPRAIVISPDAQMRT